ncbi:hypothetical protein [Burkholderia thailandensis]|uniref:hypothetical protein n=1 Tax=Burkholderia thailandensis TaxID=57975 RepID=UPI0012FD4C7F|nr:hypothetical protein [Burkholderia thailandensis]
MLDSVVIRHCSPARNWRLMRCKTGENGAGPDATRGPGDADRPPIFRGFALDGKSVCSDEYHYPFDSKRKNLAVLELARFSHHEIEFLHAVFLVLSTPGSYNDDHWLSRCGNLRMSPPPSSFGGLSPNQWFGLFFRPVQAPMAPRRPLRARDACCVWAATRRMSDFFDQPIRIPL